ARKPPQQQTRCRRGERPAGEDRDVPSSNAAAHVRAPGVIVAFRADVQTVAPSSLWTLYAFLTRNA
ncbi:MAG: hypothetical protein AB7I25_07170, partial [Vicinamibacterales bacterium]